MNLELIPPVLAIVLSVSAFAVAWMVGLASDVPAHAIALRATAAAAVFWLLGLVAGKIFLNCMVAAIGEQMAQRQAKHQLGGNGNGASARRPKA
jgi:putative Mn2+ efflux pump MntP